MFELPPFVVRARLVRPRLPRVLRRPRLLDLLADAVPRHRLTVVCAGPGYGKTTLLAELADQLRGDVLWYSLSPEDGDLTTFLWHLAALFRRVSPRAGRSLRGLLREGPLGARSEVAAGAALLNDLGALHDPAHIVLDDFHHVAAQPALVSVLASVIESLKGPVTFVLASRAVPPLPLPRWRARRQIFELGPRDLAFTHDELRDLLHDIHGRSVPEEDLARLMVSTDGWITPVQMALQAEEGAGSGSLPASLRQAGLTGGILHDYLAEEILDRQTADDRQWLLRTAGFENLEPPFLSAVFQDPAVEDRLQSLARRGLVLPYAEGGARLYRYHVLFREFLQRRAAVELPVPERDRVHQRAAELLHQQGDIIGAAQQLARMSRPDPLAALLVEQGLALIDRGQYQALVTLVESLPPEMVAGDPWLLLRLADGRHYLGQWPAAELQHEQAARLFHERGDAAGEAWALLGLARLANLRGEAERAAELCSTIGELLSRVSGEDEEILRPRLLQVHSGALYYQGRYASALALLEQLDGLTRGESGRRAALWNNRAVVAASQGDYPAAVRAFERGLEMPGARVSPRAPLHMTNLALLYCETGDAERARTLFDEALSRARSFENRSQIVSALLGQAHLDYSLGQHDQCLERLKQVAEAGTELKVPLIEADRLALKAEILAGFGQYPAARELVEQAIQTYGPARQDANALSFRIQRAVLELRGGRAAEAWSQLQELRTEAGSLEDLAPRARLLLHLGEAAFELGHDDAESHLDEALSLAGRFGHHTYFRLAIQRNVRPFLGLLRQGRRTDVLVRIVSSIGPEMEPPILPLLSEPLETAAWQAVVAILGSVGGMESHARLQQELAAAPASRRRAVESALRRIEARHAVPCPIESVSRRGLELTTLGRIRLTGPLGEIPVDSWKSRRALMIFIYLASRRGRGAPKDRLIELFWPGVSLRRAEKNFHPTLSYARRALRPHIQGPVFVSAGGLYQIAPSLALELDVVRFEQLAAELGRRTAARSPTPLLEEALRLYQGDFLEGWDDPWLEETRARLRSRYERILSEGADLLVKEGRHDRAAECLRKLIDCSPYDEDAHLRLMRCYTQLRDRNQVRLVYETLRRRLKTDLQVEPLPETRRGCEALLEK